MEKLKPGIRVIEKGGLYYTLGSDNRVIRYKPWLGDNFSFIYDWFMYNSIFPKKFGADVALHLKILSDALEDVSGKQVLELATGSGIAVDFLNSDNRYTGIDISPGLLKRAVKRFKTAGFHEPEFFVGSADDLPFSEGIFDVCLCILALNFVDDAEKLFQEVNRVLVSGGAFVCSVPVPEKNVLQSAIRGVLFSEVELVKMCEKYGFVFERVPAENGPVLYFKAIKQ